MTLFNIKQLIVIIYIISLSQCLGYIVLMSSEGYRYGHQLQNPLPYYTNEEDIISSNDDASIYDGESGEYIDYHVSPYENVIDDTIPYQNNEYEEGEAYSQDYPNVDYQTYNDENSQYYGPVEYNNMQYDQSSYDYNIPYNAYYSRRDTNDYYQERPDIQYRVSLGNRPYQYQEDYDDDDADDYYSNEGNYEDDYNSNNDNYKSQSDSNVNFRQYYKLPTASYKHQKYVPHRLDTLKDYQPIDDKLYVFYPKDIKPQYYTLRKMHTKYGKLNPYFSSRIISKKSPNGYFKNVLPTTYQSDDHHKHRDNSMHSNKNNHYYYKSINKSPNYKSIDNYSPTSNYKDHHLNGRSSSYYRNNNKNEYRPSKSKVSYPTTNNKKKNKPLRDVYGNSMRTTDYEETISYHKSGEKGPKGKMKSYSSYDIYGHLKHTGKSKLGSGITRYHTVIDSDKSKNRHYVTYQPLNNEYNK